MNPAQVDAGNPCSSPAIIAHRQRTGRSIVIVEPARWIVAHSGINERRQFGPHAELHRYWASVTGIVAADDCVPRAVA